MKKQLLSILLCLIMVVGLLPTAALAEEAAPVFNLATDLAGITIPDDLVTCICTTTNESKQYGQLTDGFSASPIQKEGDVWTVIISVKNKTYLEQFNQDMDCEHGPDPKYSTEIINQIQFKLKYEGGKWELLGEMPKNKMLHFTCGGGHVYQGAAPTIALVSRTDTDIKVTENNKWEYSKDNGETWQDSCHFTNLSPGTEYTIIARVKATATHQPSANSEPLNISTIGSAITEEDLAELDIPANLVTVKCKTTGDSKAYGAIPGGFDSSKSSLGAISEKGLGKSGNSSLKLPSTVTLLAGMMKVYLPLPMSVSLIAAPAPSTTARPSITKSLSGATVSVMVAPLGAVLWLAATVPFFAFRTVMG